MTIDSSSRVVVIFRSDTKDLLKMGTKKRRMNKILNYVDKNILLYDNLC